MSKIIRCVLSFSMVLSLSACSKHDEHYYASHPKALQKAMAYCPARANGDLSCDALKKIALRINRLAYELRMDQQAYGKKILALQEQKNRYQLQLAQNSNRSQVEQKLNQLNHRIEEHLFVVKWLESPRNSA